MQNRVLHAIDALCADVGTPRANVVRRLVARGEWTKLQKLRMRPDAHVSAGSYFKDALVTELLRKADLPTDVDKKAVAVKTFWLCEHQNKVTNLKLSRYTDLDSVYYRDSSDVRAVDIIRLWRREIRSVLGNLPSYLTPRFSGGATYADSGRFTTIPDKMSSRPTVYSETRSLLPLWGESAWARTLVKERPWFSDPLTVRGNIFFTVPKDGKTFRGCCKEASIPLAYQLDCGRLLRLRLRRIGIDLPTGQDRHKNLARMASETGALATIDLSNASDTICTELVKLVLPAEWYTLLNSLRATHTRLEGDWIRLEKFSSMGNGFTFELETLLFACLARAISILDGTSDPATVSCYGDDLIVASGTAPALMEALAMFGFTPNMNKSFLQGSFRESCGGDFFQGEPVRAHYLGKLPDEPHELISLANGLRRVAGPDVNGGLYWPLVRRAWLRIVAAIPSDIRRCRGPQNLGDIVIHDDPKAWDTSLRGDQPHVRAYLPTPVTLNWNHWTPGVQLASALVGVGSEGVTPRDPPNSKRLYRFCRVPVYGVSDILLDAPCYMGMWATLRRKALLSGR